MRKNESVRTEYYVFIVIYFDSILFIFFSSHSKLKEHEALRVDEQQRTHTLTFQRDEL